jgi:hypothetical protein
MTSRIGVVLAGALVTLVAAGSTLAAASTQAKPILFKATYSGKAVTQQTGDVVDITARGTGKGLPIGAGTITGKGKADSSIQPCAPFVGPGVMVGTARTKLAFTVLPGSSGCGDEAGQVFAVSGKAKVNSATGKLAKAKGTLKFSGTYDRGTGAFTVTFKGTLTR